MNIEYPDGKRFAFTIFDDTDVATLESIRPVYDLLYELGLRTTKTVWANEYRGESSYAGSATLAEQPYCEYLQLLQSRGFEIAFHGATMETALRPDTARALKKFRQVFGTGPTAYAAHAQNRDNPYWGKYRFQFPLWRALYTLLVGRNDPNYAGHVEDSDVYWLDLVPELRYSRSFTYDGIDLHKITSRIPYRTAATPGVKAWFPSCDADNVEDFLELLKPENQELLEARGGLCILSTHLGKGFVRQGQVLARVARALDALSRRNGWFVPVTPLLDFLVDQMGELTTVKGWPLFRLEGLWFIHTWLRRRRRQPYEATEVPYLLAAQARDSANYEKYGHESDTNDC